LLLSLFLFMCVFFFVWNARNRTPVHVGVVPYV
jgi:hypothetical protein